MITFRHKGDFRKTDAFLKKAKNGLRSASLDEYGRRGVAALMSATPVDTGLTAKSWYYEIVKTKTTTAINFKNSNIQNGVPIAVILQYGHGTRNGGWVEGRDYINPAIAPIFDEMAKKLWKEVSG